MKSKIRGLFTTATIAIGLGFIIILLYFTRKKDNAFKARRISKAFFPTNGFECSFYAPFCMDADIYILNHQSPVEIIAFEAYHPRNVCFVAKKQLGEIPYYGLALTLPEMILIDREDKRGLVHLIKECKEKLDEKRPIVIFPEGTRSLGGRDFLPFKAGAKMIVEKLGLKVQPVVVVNTRRLFDEAKLSTSGTRCRILPLTPFTPTKGTPWYEEMEANMHAIYLREYHDMGLDLDDGVGVPLDSSVASYIDENMGKDACCGADDMPRSIVINKDPNKATR